MGTVRSMPEGEQQNLVPGTLGDWLDRNVAARVVRNAILQVGEVMFPSPSENTSVGRRIAFLKQSREYGSRGMYPQDPDVPGMQGLVSPWVRIIEQHRGELWLGWKPLEIVSEDRRLTGAVPVK